MIPISDQLREILEDARRRSTGNRVVTYRGAPIAQVRGGLRMAAARAGLPYGRFTDDGLTFHTLRHTAATIMLELDIFGDPRSDTAENPNKTPHSDEKTKQAKR